MSKQFAFITLSTRTQIVLGEVADVIVVVEFIGSSLVIAFDSELK